MPVAMALRRLLGLAGNMAKAPREEALTKVQTPRALRGAVGVMFIIATVATLAFVAIGNRGEAATDKLPNKETEGHV